MRGLTHSGPNTGTDTISSLGVALFPVAEWAEGGTWSFTGRYLRDQLLLAAHYDDQEYSQRSQRFPVQPAPMINPVFPFRQSPTTYRDSRIPPHSRLVLQVSQSPSAIPLTPSRSLAVEIRANVKRLVAVLTSFVVRGLAIVARRGRYSRVLVCEGRVAMR